MKDTIEIYLDGELVDVSEDTELTLEIKSNFFTDIGDVECNRTWTFKLPKTVRNMAAMELPDKMGTGSKWKHQYHDCEIRRGGIPIVQGGRATLDGCEDGIMMIIYWGVFPAFKALQDEDKALNELGSDLYLLFQKKNEVDTLEDFTQRGYGYADYNEMQLADKTDEWKGWAVAQYAEVTTLQPLTSGKIRTGETVGGSVSGDRETDANYRAVKIPFVIGNRAQVNGIVGQGEYRAWALLDAQYKVIDLAAEPKSTFGGEAEREYDFRLTNTGYMYLVCEKEATTITKVRLGVVGRTTATTIEWGAYDPTGNANEKWGEQTVEANFVGVMEWTVARQEKPANTYIYFKQSQSGVLTGYNVADNTGTYGEKSVLGFSKNTSKSLCVTIEYDTSVPKQTDYNIRPTSDTAWLVVNADMRYSRADAVVKVFGTTRITVTNPANAHAIQPSVTVDWILALIKERTGVGFTFPEKEQAVIKNLAVPLVTLDSDARTWITKDLSATIETQRQLGNLKLVFKQTPDWIDTSTAGVMKVTQSCTATVECIAYIDISTDGWIPSGTSNRFEGGGFYITGNDYIRLTVHHADRDTEDDHYIIGLSEDAATPMQFMNVSGSQINAGIYTRMLIGNGGIDFEVGDTISMELCNDEGTHKGLKLYDGTLTMKLEESDEVPYGGNFPIGKNLPDIKVLDFVKFLCLLTGTFPKQMKEVDKEVLMISYDTLKDRQAEAYDWTEMLIPSDKRNAPRKIAYTMGDWCRHNLYKWKQDNQTRGNYDGDLQIDCDVLEYSRDAWELPFAASDFNRIPIRTATDGSRYWTANKGEKDATYQFSACEPRVMNIIGKLDEKDVERAALTFNIDLAEIFKSKYETLRKTVERPHIITERFYLTDLEIMAFDETRPVYLKQYGQYFIVSQLTVNAEGWTEAELIQINQ